MISLICRNLQVQQMSQLIGQMTLLPLSLMSIRTMSRHHQSTTYRRMRPPPQRL